MNANYYKCLMMLKIEKNSSAGNTQTHREREQCSQGRAELHEIISILTFVVVWER